MSGVKALQNLAAKIEDVKEKISDEEYKDLLELAHKYYDQEKIKEEKEKPIIYLEVEMYRPVCDISIQDPDDDEPASIIRITTGKPARLMFGLEGETSEQSLRVKMELQYRILEVMPEHYSRAEMGCDLERGQILHKHYLKLKREKYLSHEGIILIFKNEKIINRAHTT